MSETASSAKCIPCENLDKAQLLTELALIEEVAKLEMWQVSKVKECLCITREFKAKNFKVAMEFMNAAADIAEKEQHHPDFHITSWNNVSLDIYTHSLGGVTVNDLRLAALLDEIEVAVSKRK
jgi:4a-hydroxytetrahydrobiopterin dehydratase